MSSWVTKMLSWLDKMVSFFVDLYSQSVDFCNGVVTMAIFVLHRSNQ